MKEKQTYHENGKTLTNFGYSIRSKQFINACLLAGIKPTKRQASKYLRGYGLARSYVK